MVARVVAAWWLVVTFVVAVWLRVVARVACVVAVWPFVVALVAAYAATQGHVATAKVTAPDHRAATDDH